MLKLNGVVSYNANTKAVSFTGANVYIVNGLGDTQTTNGLGNLIVGYNEQGGYATQPFCPAGGQFSNKASCQASGNTWDDGSTQWQTGSHNVIIGQGHSFTSFGGLVGGLANVINRDCAAVSGGWQNLASGFVASVSGGNYNLASGSSSKQIKVIWAPCQS